MSTPSRAPAVVASPSNRLGPGPLGASARARAARPPPAGVEPAVDRHLDLSAAGIAANESSKRSEGSRTAATSCTSRAKPERVARSISSLPPAGGARPCSCFSLKQGDGGAGTARARIHGACCERTACARGRRDRHAHCPRRVVLHRAPPSPRGSRHAPRRLQLRSLGKPAVGAARGLPGVVGKDRGVLRTQRQLRPRRVDDRAGSELSLLQRRLRRALGPGAQDLPRVGMGRPRNGRPPRDAPRTHATERTPEPAVRQRLPAHLGYLAAQPAGSPPRPRSLRLLD